MDLEVICLFLINEELAEGLLVSSLACKELRSCHFMLTTSKRLNKLKTKLFLDQSEK